MEEIRSQFIDAKHIIEDKDKIIVDYETRLETMYAKYRSVPGLENCCAVLESSSSHGIILNGVLLWANIERRTVPEDVWKEEMLKHFLPEEINEAKEALWDVCREKIIGKQIKRIGDSKTRSEVDDICKGLKSLEENEVMPLIIGTDSMIMRNPLSKEKQNKTNLHSFEKKLAELNEFMKTSSKSHAELLTKNHQRVMSKMDVEGKNVDNITPSITNICTQLKNKKRVTFDNDIENGNIISTPNYTNYATLPTVQTENVPYNLLEAPTTQVTK